MGKGVEMYEAERMRLRVHNLYVGQATVICCGLNDLGMPIWALPGGKTTKVKTRAFNVAKAIDRIMTK